VKRSHRVYDAVKRLGDIVLSAVLLVVLSPLLAVTALLVRTTLGPPALFRQLRPGREGRVFTLYKFRSMTTACGLPDADAVATDAERLTRFGRFLRASSLDELPELYNVLIGDMSLVGPRPLLVAYLDRYTAEQSRRHEVRPGITGWAQVNGRNAVPWPERFAMDVWYVDNRSLALDLRILGMTVATALSRRGVSAEGHATMEPFEPDRTTEEGP
jgi:lipopolysaccharide/colanic/teichoic acid biosynthesis glycosyltransferase